MGKNMFNPRVTGPLDLGDYQIKKKEDGNLLVIHLPSGNTWEFTSDGGLEVKEFNVAELSSGTITATGGSSPAYQGRVSTGITEQTKQVMVDLYVDTGISADYQFNWDYSLFWDNSVGELK